jgi:hypothetical protein
MEPFGVPLYWMNETSGILRSAVQAYVTAETNGPDMTAEQFELFRAYLTYVIHAPCWKGLDRRRFAFKLAAATDTAAIHTILMELLDFGIDPL